MRRQFKEERVGIGSELFEQSLLQDIRKSIRGNSFSITSSPMKGHSDASNLAKRHIVRATSIELPKDPISEQLMASTQQSNR